MNIYKKQTLDLSEVLPEPFELLTEDYMLWLVDYLIDEGHILFDIVQGNKLYICMEMYGAKSRRRLLEIAETEPEFLEVLKEMFPDRL
jgi:hypothetical protein